MKNRELIVGIFAAAILTLLYFGFSYLKGTDFFSTSNVFYIKYKNVSELAVSNPVLVNGYAIGRVSKISLLHHEGNKVLVEIEIQGDVPVGKGAKGTLSSALLGSKSILLELGDISKPLSPGDTLAGDLAKGMMDLISETASPVAYDMQSTLKKFNGIIDDLTITLHALNPVIKGLNETPRKINDLLDQSKLSLAEVSSNVHEVSDKLKSSIVELDPTLRNLKVITDSVRRMELNHTLEKTRSALESLTTVLHQLNKNDNTAGKLLTEDSLYNNLNQLLRDVDVLTKHLNSNPKHFLGPLAKSKKRIEKDLKKEQ